MLNLKFKVRIGGIRNKRDRLIGWTAHQLDTRDVLLLFFFSVLFFLHYVERRKEVKNVSEQRNLNSIMIGRKLCFCFFDKNPNSAHCVRQCVVEMFALCCTWTKYHYLKLEEITRNDNNSFWKHAPAQLESNGLLL